ncbi:phage tail tape measure protein [Microtetraspora malaysiensis]|uniref:phage tail tape measure protein n=1 Tax=Microtetraspora malaysiensis TaxID=161358 RepID=UPI003D8A44B1
MAIQLRRDLRVNIDADPAGFQRGMKSAEESARTFERELAKIEAAQRRQREQMHRVGVGFAIGGAAMAAGLGLATAAAISWESAWAGVAKTVDGSQSQMAALEGQLRELSKELPASHKEIAAVAEAAGQLGIKREAIASFTRTMVMLGTATNLSSDEAATALARISNIMGTAQEDIGRLGSALVELGNNGASTEQDIVEMALRIAGAGKQIGLTEGEVLGFANALSSVGIEAEAGGTAISRVFINIATAVDEGGDRLDEFARVAGMSSSQFTAAFQQDAGGAITSFISGLDRIKKSGGSVFSTLSNLGLGEIRVRDTLLRTSAAGDLVAQSLRMGNEAWKDNTALVEEASRRYETTASKLKIAWNQIDDFAITVGNTFLPVVGAAAEKTGAWIDVIGDMPAPLRIAGTALGTIAATASLVAGAFFMGAPKVAAFKESLDNLGPRAQKFHKGLSSIGSFLAGPWGVALGAAVVGLGLWIDHQAEAAERAREWGRALEQDAGALGANTRALAVHRLEQEGLLKVAEANKISLGQFTDAIMGNSAAHAEVTKQLDAIIAANKAKYDSDQLSFEGYKAGVDGAIQLRGALRGQNEELTAALEAYRRQQAAQAGAAGAAQTHADAEKLLTQQMQAADTTADELRKSLDALVGGHIKADEATISYNQAIAEMSRALQKNGADFRLTSKAGQENTEKTIAAAKAAADRIVALKEEGRSSEYVARAAVQQRDGLIKAAMAAGISREEAKKLIAKYYEIPSEIITRIKADTAQARVAFGTIFTQMQKMANGVSIPVRYVQYGPGPSRVGPGGVLGQQPYMRASGGYISGPGTGTSDSIPAMLSNGEYVVNARSTAKHRDLLEAINAGRFARGGLVRGYASGGAVGGVSVPLSEFVDRFMGGKAMSKTDYLKVVRAEKDAVSQLRAAERKLAEDRRKHRSAKTIADDEARVAKERRDLATATEKLNAASTVYNRSKLKPTARLTASLDLGIKKAFIRNVQKIADMGFGELAQQLLAMGGPDAEKYAADAAKLSKSKLKALEAKVKTAASQQAKLEQLPAILKIKDALKHGAKSVQSMMLYTGLSEDEIAAANEVGHLFAAGGIMRYASGGWRPGPGIATRPTVLFGEGRHPEGYVPYDPAYRSRAMGLVSKMAADFGMGGSVVNHIVVNGAMDPLAVARQIEQVMTKFYRANGRSSTNIQVR